MAVPSSINYKGKRYTIDESYRFRKQATDAVKDYRATGRLAQLRVSKDARGLKVYTVYYRDAKR